VGREVSIERSAHPLPLIAQSRSPPTTSHPGARPTGIALAALSLALTQPTAPDLWFSPGPKILERSA